MKPYIFNYSETVILKQNSGQNINCISSIKTETIEPEDPDEIYAGSTLITKAPEPSDIDQTEMMSTLITRTGTEKGDEDSISLLSTKMTFTLEDVDPDELPVIN